MALKQQIQTEMISAMKAKDELKVGVLRMLKAAILKFEVSGSEKKDASDADVLQIIGKEIKQRRDSAEQFKEGNRFESAEKEEKEIEYLLAYMPPQMSEDEVRQVISEVISEVGAKSKQDMGRVMGAVMDKVKGQADGGMVKDIVASLLP